MGSHDPAGSRAGLELELAGELVGAPTKSRGIDVDTFVWQCVHMDVGVRELKQHLSEYLERAARGETIRVTDRGQPKAILGPVPGHGRLALGIAEGWIRGAEESEPVAVPRAQGGRSIAEVIGEDREG